MRLLGKSTWYCDRKRKEEDDASKAMEGGSKVKSTKVAENKKLKMRAVLIVEQTPKGYLSH